MFPPPLSHSILDVIGHTPLLELHRILALHQLPGRLLAKLEHLNPGFSKKDRIAREIMLEATAAGTLKPGQTVVELTSGNTGTGLAIVCKALGHPFIAVMSKGNTIERARMMRALGATVILVDQAPGSPPGQVSGEDLALVEQKTQALVKEHAAFRADQFHLQANVLAHFRHTGPELWQQSAGTIDVFLDFAGTGGTFTGIARFLKSQNPAIRCYLVEPASAAVLARTHIAPGLPGITPRTQENPSNPEHARQNAMPAPSPPTSHRIQGGGYAMPNLPLLDRSLVTGYLNVTDDQAIAAARQLASEEGVFSGFSSGAHLAAALALLRTQEPNATIAFLICDSGLKYLSTDLFPA